MIDIPPHIETAIIAKAEQQGISIDELLERIFIGDLWQVLDRHGISSNEIDLNADESHHLMTLLDNPPPTNHKARALLFGNGDV